MAPGMLAPLVSRMYPEACPASNWARADPVKPTSKSIEQRILSIAFPPKLCGSTLQSECLDYMQFDLFVLRGFQAVCCFALECRSDYLQFTAPMAFPFALRTGASCYWRRRSAWNLSAGHRDGDEAVWRWLYQADQDDHRPDHLLYRGARDCRRRGSEEGGQNGRPGAA